MSGSKKQANKKFKKAYMVYELYYGYYIGEKEPYKWWMLFKTRKVRDAFAEMHGFMKDEIEYEVTRKRKSRKIL